VIVLAFVGGWSKPVTHMIPQGNLVYDSDRTGGWEIYTMRPDGTSLRQPTGAQPGQNEFPAA
jgi:hypothetical protein